MGGFFKLLGAIVLTAIGMALMTTYVPGTLTARTSLLGMPVVSIAQTGAFGWLALGQQATGVLVIGQFGVGVVTFCHVGFGLLFGLGQGMLSLVAIAQFGAGAVAFLGQAGLGLQAIGQGVIKRRDRAYFASLSAELNELLGASSEPAAAKQLPPSA